MTTTTKKISDIAGLLSDREQELIYELILRLLPDDVATADDIAAIKKAEAEYSRGECVSFHSADDMAAYFDVKQ